VREHGAAPAAWLSNDCIDLFWDGHSAAHGPHASRAAIASAPVQQSSSEGLQVMGTYSSVASFEHVCCYEAS